MVKGLYIMSNHAFDRVYAPSIRAEIEKSVDIYAEPLTRDVIDYNRSVLQEAEVIFSGWGGPKLDEQFLKAAPNLKAFFYAAGSLKSIVTDACWERDLVLSSAYAANAIPVAEYTLSQVIFSLKGGWRFSTKIKQDKKYPDKREDPNIGVFGSTIGIISLSMVGKRVCELLKSFDVKVIAYDPFASQQEAERLNVELCSLEDIFTRSDVVSLHTPWLKETEGMITGEHMESMKYNSTFINTARGAVVNEPEMIEVLTRRQDITAILDVTYPEPPAADSQLYVLPNVVLTPHIAGSEGQECQRMASYMLEELKRYLAGEQLKWQITKDKFAILA